MVRKFTHMILAVLLLFGASLSVHAQSVLNKERRVSPFKLERKNDKSSVTVKVPHGRFKAMEEQMALAPVRRMATQEVDARDVVLLDSVIGDGYSKYYEYNEKGWLVSAKIYESEEEVLQLDTEESFLLEYDFDGQERCIRYSYFLYDDDATKGQEIERVEVEWNSAPYTRIERYYELCREDVDEVDLIGEVGYDKYGNICMVKTYDWDEDRETMVLEDCEEMKFTGYVMEKDEDGDLDFDDQLFEIHCYYYVCYGTNSWDGEQYKYIEGFKVDSKTEGETITRARYEVDLDEEDGDVIDFALLDSYWELDEATVITLTSSGNRFANICVYEGEEDDYVDNYPQEELPVTDKPVATRATDDWVLVYRLDFEWDEYERLAKIVYTDCEDNEVEETYTCTYYDNQYKTITLDDLLNAWICYWEDLDSDSDYYLIQAGFYGKAHKERMDWEDGYAERINVEYDNDGRVTHCTEVEVYYSEEELGGGDLNGDDEVSTEREVYNYEEWFTYDAEGNIVVSISYDDYYEASRAYKKYVYVDEQTDGRYMTGRREYEGASKEGPWTLVGEDINIFEEDPATNPDAESVEGWYRYYDYDNGTWYGDKWEIMNGEYYKVSVDPETGEFPDAAYAPATRSEELEEGYSGFYFEENGWMYEGYKEVGYVWDGDTETEVLKVVAGEMRIYRRDRLNRFYTADPADNYEFPLGPYFWMTEYEDMMPGIDWREYFVYWDVEQEKWIAPEGESYIIRTYYTNEQGQIVNEERAYGFDSESECMKETGSQIYNIYSFDELGRVSTIRYNEYTLHYVYLNDEYNYLLESYVTDNADPQGIKYSVCKYYYREGKYTNPETEVDLLESKGTWHVNGNTIVADGFIRLYNLSGQLVACGEDMVIVEQNGLYIIEVNGRQAKLWIK